MGLEHVRQRQLDTSQIYVNNDFRKGGSMSSQMLCERTDRDRRTFFKNDGSVVHLTIDEWLTEPRVKGEIDPPLPDGFEESGFAYNHWDQSNPRGWALHCWETSKTKDKWDDDHKNRVRR